MYYNNLNRQEDDDDLKFIPLNIKEPFLDKDSSWFPMIDTALPTFCDLPNSFVLGFSSSVDNSNLEGNSLKTLDFIQNSNLNVPNTGNNQAINEFNNSFNLEYPSETLSEELYSYNKDGGCKSINSSNNNNVNMPNMNNGNMNGMNMNNGNMNGMNMSNGNMNGMNMNNGNMNGMNMNNGNMNGMNTNNGNMQGYNSSYGNMQGYNSNYGNNQGSNTNKINNTGGMNNTNMKGLNGYNYNNQEARIQEGKNTRVSTNTNKDELIHMNLLRSINLDDYLYDGYRGESGNLMQEIDRIFNLIKSDNSIMDTFKAYNLPKPISDLIIKKIIKMTLENSKCKWGE